MAQLETIAAGTPDKSAVRLPVLAWGVGAIFFFYAFVQRVAPSVMIDELMREFGVGAAIVGNLSAFYFYAYVSLQIPIGLLMDRIGPRRLLAGAALVAALGSFVFAASGGLAGASAGRLLVGLGCAFSWVGTLVLATQLFAPGRFALLAGLCQMLGMAGAIFGQAPLGAAVAAWGWRPSLAFLGILGVALALGLWVLVRDRLPAGDSGAAAILAGLRRVAGKGQSWLAATIAFSLTGPMLGFTSLWAIPFFFQRYGMGREEASGLTAFMFVGWGVGAPLIGWLSDRVRRRRLLLVCCCAGSGATLAAIIYLPVPPMAAAALLFAAGAAGSGMILTFAAAREHNRAADSGAAYGLVNTATVGSGAVFQPLLGLLLDAAWDGELAGGVRLYSLDAFRAACLVLPAVSALGLTAALLLRESWGMVGGEPSRPALRG